MKSKIFKRFSQNSSAYTRAEIKNIIINKYYNLYLNAYEFDGDINYQAKEYILLRLWADGQVCAFNIKELESPLIPGSERVLFAPFAPGYWNIYNWPTKVSIINTRGVKYFPVGLQEVDKDVVIGYAQRNKKSIFSFVDHYAERMTDVLMTIRTNLKAHKMPWLIGGTPEAQAKLKALFEKLDNDDPDLFIDSEDIDKFKALVSGAPFIIDKLFNYYQCLENELREFFGFQNLGVGEKKEHLITSEVDSNNGAIEAYRDCLLDTLKEFFERVNNLFNVSINIDFRYKPLLVNNDMGDFEEEDSENE